MHSYPFVFLELLSPTGTAFAPPLRSILRVEVKEPFSEGKLERKEKKYKTGKWIRGRNTDGRVAAAIIKCE